MILYSNNLIAAKQNFVLRHSCANVTLKSNFNFEKVSLLFILIIIVFFKLNSVNFSQKLFKKMFYFHNA